MYQQITLLAGGLFLAACGGGGDGSNSSVANTSKTFTAVATDGELVQYVIDTTALTYAYEIIDSAYNLRGTRGSGTLTRNSDGTYTPNGFDGALAITSSGLLMGAVYEDLDRNGRREVIPVIGISDPVTSTQDAAGVYNFVSRQCGGNSCSNYYGTVKVNLDGTWESCVGGNLSAANPTCQQQMNGSVADFSAGRGTVTANGVAGGSMLIFKEPGTNNKVFLLDLNGRSNLGTGAIFGASQTLPTNVDGQWVYFTSNGNVTYADVVGTTYTQTSKVRGNNTQGSLNTDSFVTNEPWAGFSQAVRGREVLLHGGSGLFASYNGATISVGLKLQ